MNWYYLTEEKEVAGPVSEEDLRTMLESGSLSQASPVCWEGTEEWAEIGAILEAGSQRHEESSQSRPTNGPAKATQLSKPRGNRPGIVVGSALCILLAVGAFVYTVFSDAKSSDESMSDDIDDQRAQIEEDPKNPTSPEGQWFLGHQYHQGWEGTPQDFEEAEKWFRKSALQGHQMAQASLGQMYLKGEGVEVDYRESARWWRYAAEQGMPIAQHKMGVFYLSGLAGEQDNKLAYMWLNLTAAGDDDNIASEARELRSELAGEMTSSEIEEAQRLSREWTPKQFAELNLSSEGALERSSEEDAERASGDPNLQAYYQGLGFSDTETEAVLEYFDERLEPADAMATLAGLYELRDMWDPDKIMHWNYKAAAAGSGDSMYRLAVILHPGFALAYKGYPKGDAEQSHNWTRKAAEAGNPEGLNGMGSALWYGVMDNDGAEFLIEPNKREAIEWWRKAVKAGSSDARGNLEKYQDEIAAIEKAAPKVRSPETEKVDPILGEWALQLRSNPATIWRFNRDGSWIRPSSPGVREMTGRWERKGDVVLAWRYDPNNRYPTDPSKPLAEVHIDVDKGELFWKPLQGVLSLRGHRRSEAR